MTDAASHFGARAEHFRAALAQAEARADRIGNVRLVLALVAIVLVILPLFTREGWPWWALLPLAVVFLVLGKAHDRASEERRLAMGGLSYAEGALARLDETWRTLPDHGGDLARSPGPARYAEDLDLFGEASLYQLLSRAVSERGRRTLAQWLLTPAEPEEVRLRQVAVRTLAGERALRERLFAAGVAEDAKNLPEGALLRWGRGQAPIARQGVWAVLGLVGPLQLGAAIVLALLGYPPLVFVASLLLQLALAGAARRAVKERAETLAGPEQALLRYARLIRVAEEELTPALAPPGSLLAALRVRLASEGGPPASREVADLLRLVNLLDASRNAFFALSLGLLLLWDLNLILRTEALRARVGPRLEGWLSALAELEALASLGALLDERPDYCLPELVAGEARFTAEALAHPLIDRRQVVANDLTLGGPGSVLLLSGSNMSGKSTLLRAVGLAHALARAGGPAAARRLELSAFELHTSVRIVDSLAAGTSHFYAELVRLKEIVDASRSAERPLLYLLDEMLHGTNSRERYIGAVSVIRWLSERGATGIVTTHDLSLARVEECLPAGRVRNAHFSDEVEAQKIHFDYRLRPGPVASTNALRLMKAVGIDVELVELTPGGRAAEQS